MIPVRDGDKGASFAVRVQPRASRNAIAGEMGDALKIAFKKTADILTSLAAVKPRPFIVAFAAETGDVEKNAREKLKRKQADLIVANDVSDASIGFDSDQNEVLVIARDGKATRLPKAAKAVIANRILDLVLQHLHG